MKTITVQVTREHIKRAEVLLPEACIVSLALQEAIPLAEVVYVGVYEASLLPISSQRWYDLELPRQVAHFISKALVTPKCLRWLFVRPFRFRLAVPEDFFPVEPERCLSPDIAVPVVTREKEEVVV